MAIKGPMTCPACAAPMEALSLEGHQGAKVAIDLCRTCQVIWFDRYESLQLAPGSTLRLFRLIGERADASASRIPPTLKCPRCELRLSLTDDRQRNTRFRYWRCSREHGRLITFFDFLREKDFIRPLSPAQLAELRQNVQTINCSNCGAPIDLGRQSACEHCGSAISMLDLGRIGQMADQLRAAGEKSTTLDPTLPRQVDQEERQIDALFALLKGDRDWDQSRPIGLIEAGVRLVSKWLR